MMGDPSDFTGGCECGGGGKLGVDQVRRRSSVHFYCSLRSWDTVPV